jgi:hypothetical protein
MVKKRLMLGAAFAALGLIPLTSQTASAQDVIDDFDLDITADWDNDVDVELDWDVDVSKELNIFGNISIDGSVTANALSQATLDDKQVLTGNDIEFEDYQNANSGTDEDNLAEPNPGLNDTADDAEGEPTEATYSNTIISTSSANAASGNVGINLAAGDYNLQENAAVISNADGVFPDETVTNTSSATAAAAGNFTFTTSISTQTGTAAPVTTAVTVSSSFNVTSSFTTASSSFRSGFTSGAAEAGNFSLQSLFDNGFNDDRYEVENTDIDNTVDVSGALNAGDGNLGMNAAAGAFNIQKNALVIANVTGGHLAEATSAILQHSRAIAP